MPFSELLLSFDQAFPRPPRDVKIPRRSSGLHVLASHSISRHPLPIPTYPPRQTRNGQVCITADADLTGRQSWSAPLFVRWVTYPQTRERTGSLLFCPDCGTLLSLPKDGETVVVCEQCAYEEPATCEFHLLLDRWRCHCLLIVLCMDS